MSFQAKEHHVLDFSRAVAAGPRAVETAPAHWFTPITLMEEAGWPDFSPTSLADWASSQRPPRLDHVDDCALVLVFPRMAYPVHDQDRWRLIAHETGGAWCETKLLAVRRLTMSERGSIIAENIARRWAASNLNAKFATMDQLAEYRANLEEYGLDCNHNVQSLAEAFYPIDLGEEALEILTGEVPEDAARFLDHGAMAMAIMAPNCSDI